LRTRLASSNHHHLFDARESNFLVRRVCERFT
jgi:hypothetical protein